MITASLCTIPERKESFRQVIQRILHEQTQPIDELHVWLNGYQQIDSSLPQDNRLIYHLEPSNPGPWIRYKAAEITPEYEYFVTIDDDMDYPPDYIQNGINALIKKANCAVSYFGLLWDWLMPTEIINYSRGRIQFDLSIETQCWQQMSLMAGCVSFFHTLHLKNIIQHSLQGFKTNDDMMVSLGLFKRGIPIFCPPRPANWIKSLQQANAPHALYRRDSNTRFSVFRQIINNFDFDPTAGQAKKELHQSTRVLILGQEPPTLYHLKTFSEYCSPETNIDVIFPVQNSDAGKYKKFQSSPFRLHPVEYIDPGGRFEWFLPVKFSRNLIVNSEKQRLLKKTINYAKLLLNPTEIIAYK